MKRIQKHTPCEALGPSQRRDRDRCRQEEESMHGWRFREHREIRCSIQQSNTVSQQPTPLNTHISYGVHALNFVNSVCKAA
mmetsp:Transcript_25713/g.57423  ORF Transcript_25713/g.57423 Transcript_25713/m.57423 type:complete len:81 (-) Transcript_25713:180-422(-)